MHFHDDITDLVHFSSETMAKANLFESERFFCDLYCLRPGQSQKVHTHAANDKVYVILRGRGKVRVGNEERTLAEGGAACAPAGALHGIENDSDDDLICLVFMAPHPKFE